MKVFRQVFDCYLQKYYYLFAYICNFIQLLLLKFIVVLVEILESRAIVHFLRYYRFIKTVP